MKEASDLLLERYLSESSPVCDVHASHGVKGEDRCSI